MADETVNDSLNSDRAAADEAERKRQEEARLEAEAAEEQRGFLAMESAERGAAARIRAFEDEHLGAEAVRINDKIERGSGSPFAALSDEHKRQYAALEKLVAAEQKLADAHAALIQADVEHDAALAAAEPAPDAE